MSITLLVSVYSLISAIFAVVAFSIGNTWRLSEYNQNLATKPYVDQGLADTRKFAIEQDKIVLKDAHDWSDRNHDDMVLRMEKSQSELKSKIEGQSARTEMILDGMRRLEDQLRDRRNK